MEEVIRIVQRLDRARQKMRGILAELEPQTGIYPGWGIPQLQAHLAGWDEMVVRILASHAEGKKGAIPWEKNIDGYNTDFVQERAHLTPAQAMMDWENARDQLKRALLELPPGKFGERLSPPWGGEATVEEVVAIMYEHEEEHAAELERKHRL